MQFSNHYLVTAIKNAQILQGNCPLRLSLAIDATKAKSGDIFCFIENTPDILEKLFLKGITGIIIAHSKLDQILPHIKKLAGQDFFLIAVPNVTDALCQLAKQIRIDTKEKIVIAVSGTSGTRATKILLSHMIQQHGNPVVIANEDATLLQLALFVINMSHLNEILLFEALSYKRYDIKTIAETIRPSHAIINSIGHCSIDTIGSVHDVATEQRNIFSSFTADNVGIINGDQKELSSISYPHPIIKFGQKISNQIQARKIRISNSQIHCILKIYKNKYPIVIKNTNSEMVSSILSAAAMAKLLAIPDDLILSIIQKPLQISRCFENKKIKSGHGNVIDDTLNADPASMKASLLAFQHLEHFGPKIIVLGDMGGLGISSAFWHRQIGRFLRKVPSVQRLFIVGKHGEHLAKTAPKEFDPIIAHEWQELIPHLKEYFSSKPVILIKGDQENGLSHLVDTLCNE